MLLTSFFCCCLLGFSVLFSSCACFQQWLPSFLFVFQFSMKPAVQKYMLFSFKYFMQASSRPLPATGCSCLSAVTWLRPCCSPWLRWRTSPASGCSSFRLFRSSPAPLVCKLGLFWVLVGRREPVRHVNPAGRHSFIMRWSSCSQKHKSTPFKMTIRTSNHQSDLSVLKLMLRPNEAVLPLVGPISLKSLYAIWIHSQSTKNKT